MSGAQDIQFSSGILEISDILWYNKDRNSVMKEANEMKEKEALVKTEESICETCGGQEKCVPVPDDTLKDVNGGIKAPTVPTKKIDEDLKERA